MSQSASEPQHERPIQPPIEHPLELRRRMMWAVIGIVICFLDMMPFTQRLYTFAAEPLTANLSKDTSMITAGVIAPFFVPTKAILTAAFLLSLPHMLYQVWAFIVPVLHQNKKRLITLLVLSSVALFFVGMAFAYSLVFPVIFKFLAGTTPVGVDIVTDIDKYLSFTLGMFVVFGTAFEVPVAVVLLARMGTASIAQFKNAHPYTIAGAFIVAAIITSPDVIPQALLAASLTLLYEVDIWPSRFAKTETQQEDEDAPQPPAET